MTSQRTPCAVDVVALISTLRLNLATEKLTQAEMATELAKAYGEDAVSREHRLGPADIPDFVLFGSIVVELKGRRHRADPVYRQLQRYAAYAEVEHLVLATARAMSLPDEVGGKPLTVINLGRAWL